MGTNATEMDGTTPRRRSSLAGWAIAAALVLGGGLGAVAAVLAGHGTKTVVRQVTAPPTGHGALASSSRNAVAAVAKSASSGVVEIDVQESGGGAEGSGFVYDGGGHIVTNQHVVDGGSSYTVVFADGTKTKATLVGSDRSTDLAVLRVRGPAARLHPLALGDSTTLAVGDGVVAIGSPFGLENSVTSGIVSALGREIQAPDGTPIENAIQTDAAINHGNSGGPLLDLAGKVIGVNAQINSESGGNDGVGFAIPSSTVRSVAGQLIATGKARHGFLGVSIAARPGGVGVTSVQPGSAADSAGLQIGDVIVAVNGTKVSTAAQLRAAVSSRQPGARVTVRILRGGSTRTVHVTLGTRPSS